MDLQHYRNERLRRKRPLLRAMNNPVSVASGGATIGSGGAVGAATGPSSTPSTVQASFYSYAPWWGYNPWWWWGGYNPYLYSWGWPMGYGYVPPYQPYWYSGYAYPGYPRRYVAAA